MEVQRSDGFTLKEFSESVVKRFCQELTDLLFLYIENDRATGLVSPPAAGQVGS